MTNEVKLRLFLELRRQEAETKLLKNQEKESILETREDTMFWEGCAHQCDEILAFLDGKIEVNVTTTVRYR